MATAQDFPPPTPPAKEPTIFPVAPVADPMDIPPPPTPPAKEPTIFPSS